MHTFGLTMHTKAPCAFAPFCYYFFAIIVFRLFSLLSFIYVFSLVNKHDDDDDDDDGVKNDRTCLPKCAPGTPMIFLCEKITP